MGQGIRSKEPGGLILAIDPGRMLGWALLRDGVLVNCGHVSKDSALSGTLGARARSAGQSQIPSPEELEGAKVIAERPTYRGRNAGENKSTPEDLISLALTLGQLVGLYTRKVEVVEFVTPQEWKGSVPKEVCHNRVQKILDPSEEWPANHNARDAVGIGLWRVGRYRR